MYIKLPYFLRLMPNVLCKGATVLTQFVLKLTLILFCSSWVQVTLKLEIFCYRLL
jgi:hypothetical protein